MKKTILFELLTCQKRNTKCYTGIRYTSQNQLKFETMKIKNIKYLIKINKSLQMQNLLTFIFKKTLYIVIIFHISNLYLNEKVCQQNVNFIIMIQHKQ